MKKLRKDHIDKNRPTKDWNTIPEAHSKIKEALGENSPSLNTVGRYAEKDFKAGSKLVVKSGARDTKYVHPTWVQFMIGVFGVFLFLLIAYFLIISYATG